MNKIKNNLAEIYVGILLFIGIPTVGMIFFDWRMFILLTILLQSAIGILYLMRGK